MKKALVVIAVLSVTMTCTSPSGESRGGHVKIWEIDDPQSLNPFTTSSATAHYICDNIFQRLLNQSYSSDELLPVLAIERPHIVTSSDSMRLTFEIRPEARWDNREPITAKDVEFSFKAVMCPGVNSVHYHPYLSFISGFRFYDDNPRKFDILCDRIYMRAEYSAGYEVFIMPSYIYDPENVLARFSFEQLRNDTSLARRPDIQSFARAFNSEKHGREKGFVVGSGPYALETWQTGQRVEIIRKEEWWGNKVEAPGNMFFEAYPDRITYEVISDMTAAITALKGERIDVMYSIAADPYVNDLKKNERVLARFNLHEAPFLVFSAFGMNTRNPKLSNNLTRQALNHLMDYDRVINDIMMGMATRVVGPVHPSSEGAYHSGLPLYDYKPSKATALLRKAGWKDSNGDGILDSIIDGKRTDLTIEFLLNQGNILREHIALIFQNGCEQAGVKIKLTALDANVVLQRMAAHEFEMYYQVWVFEQAPTDYNQIFSTAAWHGGSNYTYFGNAETDALIAAMNKTVDEDARTPMLKQLQEILHHEVPFIFLWTQQQRIAIHKRFTNANVSVTKPGFWAAGFKTIPGMEESADPAADSLGGI